MKKIVLFLILWLAASTSYALPGVKQFQALWTANTEADLAGYKLYWRTTGGEFTDANSVAIAAPKTSQILTGVVPNKSEIAVTAYDTSGNESSFSTVIFFDKDGVAPSVPSGVTILPVP